MVEDRSSRRGGTLPISEIPADTERLPIRVRGDLDEAQVAHFHADISLKIKILESLTAASSALGRTPETSNTSERMREIKHLLRQNYPLIAYHPKADLEQIGQLHGGPSKLLQFVSSAMARSGFNFERIELSESGLTAITGLHQEPVDLRDLRLDHLEPFLSKLHQKLETVYKSVEGAMASSHASTVHSRFRAEGYEGRMAKIARIDIAAYYSREAKKALTDDIGIKPFPSVSVAKALVAGPDAMTTADGTRAILLTGSVYVISPGKAYDFAIDGNGTREWTSTGVMCVTEVLISEGNGKLAVTMGRDRPLRLEQLEKAITLEILKNNDPDLYSKVSALVKHAYAQNGNLSGTNEILRAEVGYVHDAYQTLAHQDRSPDRGPTNGF